MRAGWRVGFVAVVLALSAAAPATPEDAPRPRVLVSTDIGGTDPDDFQSLVLLLVYADRLAIEGLVSSPYGPGRKEHILQVLDLYERDYPNLRTHSSAYPTPDALRAVTKQGALESPGRSGLGAATEGSDWIVACARRPGPRPLWVLVWGGIEDLAQALHDAPDILPKLRVYFVGGPNKTWSVDAYSYIEENHPGLWIIEANATYRGAFVGGPQDGDLGNREFVTTHVAGRGALGSFFATLLGGTLKIGDAPSVWRLLHGAPEDPSKGGWGGRFVRVWGGRKAAFNRLTTAADRVEVFGVVELSLPLPDGMSAVNRVEVAFGRRAPVRVDNDGRRLRVRFSPRDAGLWPYVFRSDFAGLDGRAGALTAVAPPPERTSHPSQRHPNWWTDDPDPAEAEGVHPGARSVSRWREDALRDFAARLQRCAPPARRRVIVLTDIENEPDDAQSLVRFLTYANQWDVEGLIATTSVHQKDKTAAWRIRQIVEAYGQVRDNLERHEPGFPTAERLLSVVREGRPAYGMAAVGQGMDSPGSELIVKALEREDPRPLWVLVWGGPNCLAQALWTIRATRPAARVEELVGRLRVYTISDQDDSGPWIRSEFPGLFYIASPGMHAGGAYHHATWSGISGDRFHGRFTGADFSLVDNPWLEKNVRGKGPLGAQYPPVRFLMEGDSPSFLYLVDNGLGDPEHPDWGSWGGRYELYTPRIRKHFLQPETRPLWTDAEDEVLGADGQWHTGNHATIWRWRAAYQNDFAARMDWTVKPYAEANHPPVPKLAHPSRLTARPGERVELSAEGSTDPDGDALSYEWFCYPEPGSFTTSAARTGQPIEIRDHDKVKASFTVPTDRVLRNGTLHVILAVTDQGRPPLTRYRRVIIDVQPP
jgi:hypothetical protein